jgi:hypothetical protein
MLVALLALFVAMGGTGYAVSTLPKRSVGPAQLRKNAVRAVHIKAGSITSAKLAPSTLSSLRPPVASPSVAGAAAASSSAPDHVAYADKAGLADRATLADRAAVAGDAASANTAKVADNAKLAENASKLGGKSVAQFLTADTIRWIEPFSMGAGTRKMLEVGPFTLTARCTLGATIGGVANQDLADILISTDDEKEKPGAFDGEDLAGRFDEDHDPEQSQFVNTAVAPHGQAKFEASSDGVAIGGDGVLYIKGSYLFAGMNINGEAGRCKFGGYIFL